MYTNWNQAGHRGPVGLCTCIISGGREFETSRRRLFILLLSNHIFNSTRFSSLPNGLVVCMLNSNYFFVDLNVL